MFDKDFYYSLREKMAEHDMLYNEFIDFRDTSPLKKANFNILQGNIIGYISNRGDLTMHELSKIVNVLPTNLSPIVKELERRGWVERYRKENDKRYVYVRLSEEGEKNIQIHRGTVVEHLKRSLEAALTEEEQADYNTIYRRLVVYFEKLVAENKKTKFD